MSRPLAACCLALLAAAPARGQAPGEPIRLTLHPAAPSSPALRCVEAVRLYAAGHGGKLPPKLADVKEVPVPHDPVTGKPFEYKVSGDRATLFGPSPVGDPRDGGYALTYELTLKR